MGKDKTPTSRSDQSESAVAIAANATVVRKSVRRPRPTPVGGAGIDLSPEAFCCCVFHGVKSREMTPGGENILVAYLALAPRKTSIFPEAVSCRIFRPLDVDAAGIGVQSDCFRCDYVSEARPSSDGVLMEARAIGFRPGAGRSVS